MAEHLPDLMYQDEIREVVGDTYRALPRGGGHRVAERLYGAAALTQLPRTAIDWALGVGDPVRQADLLPGEVVLDLGCGGGIDSVLAAHRIGPDGRVIGVDLLSEMCDRARDSADRAGVADRCQFVPGLMESLPLPDDSIDVVVSNGVLNLSPRKSRALAEAILRRKLDRVGFTDIRIDQGVPFGVDQAASYPLFTPEVVQLLRRSMPAARQRRIATAVLVRAVKPAAGRRTTRPPMADWRTGVTHLDDIDPDSVEAPGVTVRLLKRVEEIELKVLDVEPGGSTPFHTHSHAHEGIVVSGAGRLRLADHHEPLRPGSTFSVNPADRHAIQNAGDVPLRFVCMDCLLV